MDFSDYPGNYIIGNLIKITVELILITRFGGVCRRKFLPVYPIAQSG